MNDLFPALVAGATGFGQGRLADRDWQRAQEQQAWQRGMAEREFGLQERSTEAQMAQAEAMTALAQRRFEKVELSAEDRARMADEHRMWYDRFMAGLARDEFDENSYYKRQKEAREQGIYEEDIKGRELQLRMVFEQFQEWLNNADFRSLMQGLERYDVELGLGLKELQVAAGLYEKEHILPERAKAAQIANDVAEHQLYKIDQLVDFQIMLEKWLGENEGLLSDVQLSEALYLREQLPDMIDRQRRESDARIAGLRAETAQRYMTMRAAEAELETARGDLGSVSDRALTALLSGFEPRWEEVPGKSAVEPPTLVEKYSAAQLSQMQPILQEMERRGMRDALMPFVVAGYWDLPDPRVETLKRYEDRRQRGVRMFGTEPSPTMRLAMPALGEGLFGRENLTRTGVGLLGRIPGAVPGIVGLGALDAMVGGLPEAAAHGATALPSSSSRLFSTVPDRQAISTEIDLRDARQQAQWDKERVPMRIDSDVGLRSEVVRDRRSGLRFRVSPRNLDYDPLSAITGRAKIIPIDGMGTTRSISIRELVDNFDQLVLPRAAR